MRSFAMSMYLTRTAGAVLFALAVLFSRVVVAAEVTRAPVARTAPSSVAANAPAPKNLIIMIGDGMGPAQLAAYRRFATARAIQRGKLPQGSDEQPTIFDRLTLGAVGTQPRGKKDAVTDSAAAATALSCGFKTFNGALCVDPRGRPHKPLFWYARQAGKSTGVVVTSQINHATPAAFAAATPQRHNYQDIAAQYLAPFTHGKPLMEVMLGGGVRYFTGSHSGLLDRARADGYQVVIRAEDFSRLNAAAPMLGLFAQKGLPAYLDRKETAVRLSAMTRLALQRLVKNPQGFVLMVEGSQIDWAGHDNDVLDMLWETEEFAQAVTVVKQFVDSHANTTMVVTADHETGGFSVGARGDYQWSPGPLLGASMSLRQMSKRWKKGASWASLWRAQGVNPVPALPPPDSYKLNLKRRLALLSAVYDQLTDTGWTSHGHTGVDVRLMAYGSAATVFSGWWQNDELGRQFIHWMKPAVANTVKIPAKPSAHVRITH